MNKVHIRIICSYKQLNNIEVTAIPDVHAQDDQVYILSENSTLSDYAQEWKNKVRELEQRYSYLERSREWAIKNFRGLLK